MKLIVLKIVVPFFKRVTTRFWQALEGIKRHKEEFVLFFSLPLRREEELNLTSKLMYGLNFRHILKNLTNQFQSIPLSVENKCTL